MMNTSIKFHQNASSIERYHITQTMLTDHTRTDRQTEKHNYTYGWQRHNKVTV